MNSNLKGLLLSGLLVFCAIQEVSATTPTEQIQQTIHQVLKVVNGSSIAADERREMLRDSLMPRFDWPEMAKRALGKHWETASGRHQEFVGAFAEFLGSAYLGTIDSYKDEEILFTLERVQQNRAQVDTKIIPKKGAPTSVNYRLHRVRDEWKIYDVVVEDISLVENYRSQFNRILATGSFDDLLKRLKSRN
jgi:phospholipid transport system substrate-binding protein